MHKFAQTCLRRGARAGALGLWADPFEGRAGVGQISFYHGLKRTDVRVNEAVGIE